MSDDLNRRSYSEVAKEADKHPNVWIPLRTDQATANLVTAINSGNNKDFPSSRFTARSRSWVTRAAEGGARRYDIDVRASEPPTEDAQARAKAIVEQLMPEIEKLLVTALEKELSK